MSILLPIWGSDQIFSHTMSSLRTQASEIGHKRGKKGHLLFKGLFCDLFAHWSLVSCVCACKSCPSAERPDLTVTLLVHNGKDPPEPVLIIARPLRNTEAPNLRIANKKNQVKQRQPLFWSCCSDNDNICYNINTRSTKFVTLFTFTLVLINQEITKSFMVFLRLRKSLIQIPQIGVYHLIWVFPKGDYEDLQS